jgi:Rap1a immunity proteins
MKNWLSALAIFVFLTCGAAAHGGTSTDTGNDLANLCSEGDKPDGHFEGGVCAGFIMGVSVVIDDVCHGANVTNGHVIKVARKYLDDHPEELNLPAQTLVHRSLTKAFPCPKSN